MVGCQKKMSLFEYPTVFGAEKYGGPKKEYDVDT